MGQSRVSIHHPKKKKRLTRASQLQLSESPSGPTRQGKGPARTRGNGGFNISTVRGADLLELQRTIGNKNVNRLLKGAEDAPLQRKLDEGKYSSDALAAAQMTAGKRLFGRTSFAKVKLALAAYYNSANQAEEFLNLNKILSACDTYLQRSTRTKTHKAAKQAREDRKMGLVNDLVADARAEISHLKANVEAPLLQHFIGEDPEAAVMAVSNKLAQVMGISLDALKAMSPEDLKVDFIEKVYLDYSMKTKALKDTGEKGKLIEQIELSLSTVYTPIDASKLPDGDAKDLYDKIKASQIDNPTAYRSSKAPKFIRGGSTDEKFQPDVKGWSKENEIQISGNADFQVKVKGLIETIKGVPVGQALLQGLGSAETVDEDMVHDKAKNTVVKIAPPSISSVSRKDATTGDYMYSASAGGSSVAIDPDNPFVGEDVTKGETEKWRIRDAAIGLFHEMIHAYLHKKGGEEFSAKEDESKKLKIGSQGGMSEVRITGVPYETEEGDNKYTYPFDDPEYNYISENTFRKEFAASKGLEEAYLRPSYGNQPGQKPLGLEPVKLDNK